MTLTGQGYVPLGQAQTAQVGKFNPYHDESGRFTTADGAGGSTSPKSSADDGVHIAENEETIAPANPSSASVSDRTQEALISCDELWDSDWAICHSTMFEGDPYHYKQCMIGLLQRNKECLGGLPLSPLLPY